MIEPLYGFAAPGGYKDEHITHYTAGEPARVGAPHELEVVDHAYVLRSELILAMRKPGHSPACR